MRDVSSLGLSVKDTFSVILETFSALKTSAKIISVYMSIRTYMLEWLGNVVSLNYWNGMFTFILYMRGMNIIFGMIMGKVYFGIYEMEFLSFIRDTSPQLFFVKHTRDNVT